MYTLPELTYNKEALEPHIDAKTMEIHHGKHHAAYVAKLNDALQAAGAAKPLPLPIEELVKTIDASNPASNPAIRNNAGGHLNHSMFWTLLSPQGGGSPEGSLAAAIQRDFGSFSALKEKFTHSAMTRFGSGWAWLCVGSDKKLVIGSTPNQDNPLMPVSEFKASPVLGLDVWEHAYYLLYQNRRPDYIAAFWNLINWKQAEKNYQQALK